MKTFNNYKSAEEFAEIRFEDIEEGESILVMKKGNKYLVTRNYREAKDNGYELITEFYKNIC